MGLLGNLMVKLGINTSQFTAGLNHASSAANKFSKNLSGSFKQANNGSQKASKQLNIFAKQMNGTFKDVGRIAQGIIIAQGFYRTTNAIQGAIGALGEFSMKSEEAQASFGLLLRDQGKADRFMTMIEDFAARTPYTFNEAAENARKLLAYGMNPSSMEPIMNALADASAAAGDPEAFNRVAKAIGQIHTKGRLASQEMLQLTEAGIPAFEILRDKLKLTNDQLAEVGKLKIPADIAIKAILQGMQDRYGGAANIMSNTVNGMLSTIKDNALIIGKEAFTPLYTSFKSVLGKIRDTSDRLREAVRSGGMSALLQNFIPPEVYAKVQVLASHLRILKSIFVELHRALWPIISTVGIYFLNAINLILPPLNFFAGVLVAIIQILTSSSQAVRILVGSFFGLIIAGWVTKILLNFGAVVKGLFIVRVLAQMIIYLAQAFRMLTIAMISNPWIALLGIGAGALLYFGLTSKKVSGWIDGVGTGIAKAFGTDPSKQFEPPMKKNNKVANEFNKNLEVSKDNLDKMGDSAKKAGKKAKDALMSFDEVFNLKDPDEDAGGGNGGLDLGNLENLGDMGTIPPIGIPEPEFPEVGAPIQKWVDKFKDTLLSKLKNTLVGAGIGAAIGAVIGGILGGPGGAVLGAKIGALAGSIAGYFWDQLSDKMKTTVKGAGVGASIGAVIGLLLGGPGGALIGAGIGTLVGGIVAYFWDDLKKVFTENTGKGASVGVVVGAIVGFAFGGPFGAKIGMILGTVLGGVVGHFWDDMVSYFKSSSGKGASTGATVGSIVGGMMGGPLGSVLGGIIGGILGHHWQEIQTWWNNTRQGFGQWKADTKTIFDNWKNETAAGVDSWKINTLTGFQNWWSNTKLGFNTWMSDTKTGFGTWVADSKMGFDKWKTDSLAIFNPWWSDTKTNFGTWATDTKTGFDTWKTNTLALFTDWDGLSKEKIGTWWADTKQGFGTWWENTKQGFNTWKGSTDGSVSSWSGMTKGRFSTWWGETKSGFGSWYSDTRGKVAGWKSDTSTSIGTWYNDTLGKLNNWWGNTKSGFGSWWSSSKQGFEEWSRGIYYNVTGWFGKMSDNLHNFFEKLKFWKKDTDKEYRDTSRSYAEYGRSMAGHAKGGIFNKEHMARFAEGNKAEAIIPLEDPAAMQPFVDAVAGGISSSMGSIMAQIGSATQTTPPGTNFVDDRPILYVGTLVASEDSLRELDHKMQVVRLQESRRR